MPAVNAIPLPDAIDFVTAAAFPLAFLTAWHMLHTRARLAERETVLVIAAGSGVGQAAVQLAKAAGARVIATAGSAAKLAMAKQIGADDVIDHHQEDVVARVRELTESPRRQRRHRTRRCRDVGPQRPIPRARRPARHLRRDDRPRRYP